MMTGWDDPHAPTFARAAFVPRVVAGSLLVLLFVVALIARAHEARRGVPLYQPPAHRTATIVPAQSTGELVTPSTPTPASVCAQEAAWRDADSFPCLRTRLR